MSERTAEQLAADVREALDRLALPGRAAYSEPRAVEALDALLSRLTAAEQALREIAHGDSYGSVHLQEIARRVLADAASTEEVCPNCEGDGSLDDGRDCQWCGGTGFVRGTEGQR